MNDGLKSKTVLFIRPSKSTFIENDINILSKYYRLKIVDTTNVFSLAFFIKEFFRLFHYLFIIPKVDFIYIWFADYYSLIPVLIARIFNKKSFVVIGGFEGANLPEYNYGGLRKPLRRWCIKYSCVFAHRLLPVSNFVLDQLNNNLNRDYSKKAIIIYNGADENYFKKNPELKKVNKVTMIAGGRSMMRIYIKSVDFFSEVARAMPGIQFEVIGLKGEAAKYVDNSKISNLDSPGYLTKEEIRNRLSEAKLICQFSRYESFGLALVEGMLCECVPVGLDYGGTSEIITGEVGCKISELNIEEARKAVNISLISYNKLGQKARQRVIDNFTLERREKELKQILK